MVMKYTWGTAGSTWPLCGIKSKQQNAASIVGQAKPANPQLSASWVATAETA